MRINFVAYKRTNGEVVYWGSADEPLALETLELAVLTDVIGEPGYVMNNSQFYALPEQPSVAHVFNYITKQWEDPRTLQNLKDEAWTRIKQSRTNAIDAPLVTPYGTFDSGPRDRTNITDAVLLLQTMAAAGTPIDIDFTLSNNTTVTLTTAQMVTVGLLLGQKVQAAHSTSRSLRAAIDASTSAAQLEGITWPI